MSNNNISKNLKNNSSQILDWSIIQKDMKSKMGIDIYDSWLRKIDFVEEMNNYILLSVSTRFIRDWITSSYLDQILKIVKVYKKDLTRIEFKIVDNSNGNNPDAFPLDSKEWEYTVGDGIGDNSEDCGYSAGNSTEFDVGC